MTNRTAVMSWAILGGGLLAVCRVCDAKPGPALSCLTAAERAGTISACENAANAPLPVQSGPAGMRPEALPRLDLPAPGRSRGGADELTLYPDYPGDYGGRDGSFLTGMAHGFASGFKSVYYGIMTPADWLVYDPDHEHPTACKVAGWSLGAILLAPALALGFLHGLWDTIPGGISEKVDPGSTRDI